MDCSSDNRASCRGLDEETSVSEGGGVVMKVYEDDKQS